MNRAAFSVGVALLAGILASVEGATGNATAGARLDRWEIIGPGGGGTMTHPTISPHDPNVVLVACDMLVLRFTKSMPRLFDTFTAATN